MPFSVSDLVPVSPHFALVSTPPSGLTLHAGVNAPLHSTNRYQLGGRTITQRGVYRISALTTLGPALGTEKEKKRAGLFSPKKKEVAPLVSLEEEPPFEDQPMTATASASSSTDQPQPVPIAVPSVMSFSSDGMPLSSGRMVGGGAVGLAAQASSSGFVGPVSDNPLSPRHDVEQGEYWIRLLMNDQPLLQHGFGPAAGSFLLQRVLFLEAQSHFDVHIAIKEGSRVADVSLLIETLAAPAGKGAPVIASALPPAAPLVLSSSSSYPMPSFYPSEPAYPQEQDEVDVWAPMVPLDRTDDPPYDAATEDVNPWG